MALETPGLCKSEPRIANEGIYLPNRLHWIISFKSFANPFSNFRPFVCFFSQLPFLQTHKKQVFCVIFNSSRFSNNCRHSFNVGYLFVFIVNQKLRTKQIFLIISAAFQRNRLKATFNNHLIARTLMIST